MSAAACSRVTPDVPPSAPAPGAAALSEKARTGVLWVTGLNLFRDLLQFGTMLVLVRLLTSKAYGEFSLISSVMVFFTVFSFRSFLEHTLQLRPGETVDYQSHFTAGCLMQLGMCALVNVTALALRHLPKYAEIAPILHATSVFFVLDWAAELRVKMLERELNWKRLRSLQAVGIVCNASLAIVLAKLGFGVYALVLPGMMAALPFIWDLFFRLRWRPNWSWNAAHYGAAWSYGWTRIMAGMLTTARPVMEGAVIVQFTGFSQLGFMSRAVALSVLCCQKMPSVLTMTLYPVLTRMARRSQAFERANGLVLRLVGWMAIPCAILFSLVAHPVVRLVYGSKWDSAIPLLPYALAGGTAGALYQAATLLMLADVQHRACAVAEFLTLASLAVCLLVVLPHGIAPYLSAVAAVQTMVLLWMLWSLRRSSALSARAIARGIVAPLAAATAAWLACAALPRAGSMLSIAGVSLLFAAVYGLALQIACPHEMRELISYLPMPAAVAQVCRQARACMLPLARRPKMRPSRPMDGPAQAAAASQAAESPGMSSRGALPFASRPEMQPSRPIDPPPQATAASQAAESPGMSIRGALPLASLPAMQPPRPIEAPAASQAAESPGMFPLASRPKMPPPPPAAAGVFDHPTPDARKSAKGGNP